MNIKKRFFLLVPLIGLMVFIFVNRVYADSDEYDFDRYIFNEDGLRSGKFGNKKTLSKPSYLAGQHSDEISFRKRTDQDVFSGVIFKKSPKSSSRDQVYKSKVNPSGSIDEDEELSFDDLSEEEILALLENEDFYDW